MASKHVSWFERLNKGAILHFYTCSSAELGLGHQMLHAFGQTVEPQLLQAGVRGQIYFRESDFAL